jgi:radical SAM family uncharacterized protein
MFTLARYNTPMNEKNLEIFAEQVERDLLDAVRRPARYIGGEVNQVLKDLAQCDVRVALCFPDVYEVAMSHSGLAILYTILNGLPGVAAERVFAPWTDAEAVLRDKGIPLFSLESKASLKSFDILGFSLSNELCYTNVLNMLDLGGLEIRSENRGPSDPLVIVGGGMANCCEPMAHFIDGFVLGDGEETVVDLVHHLRAAKAAGRSKEEILLDAARAFDWFYVPQYYRVDYDAHAGVSVMPTVADLEVKRTGAVLGDLENAPLATRPIVPSIEAVHERVCIEIMRGCPGRCRFCQVSYCKRPIRYRSVERIVAAAQACYEATGFDTVTLLSLSSAEYPQLEELLTALQACFEGKHVGLSVPSLRVDRQLRLLPKLLTSVRKSGLTIAVEAASEKLRRIIHKPLSDEDLFAAVEAAYQAGWQKIKLYFMVGLPGETEEDIKCIVGLALALARLRKQVDGRLAQINVAVSWLVPKAHTPFAWYGQRSASYFHAAKELIIAEKNKLKARCLTFKFHDIERSVLESALGRGDRRLDQVIETAWRAGARFDLWHECFDLGIWQRAFSECGVDLPAVAAQQFDVHASLPWEHLGGPDKASILRHYEAAMKIIDA